MRTAWWFIREGLRDLRSEKKQAKRLSCCRMKVILLMKCSGGSLAPPPPPPMMWHLWLYMWSEFRQCRTQRKKSKTQKGSVQFKIGTLEVPACPFLVTPNVLEISHYADFLYQTRFVCCWVLSTGIQVRHVTHVCWQNTGPFTPTAVRIPQFSHLFQKQINILDTCKRIRSSRLSSVT